MNATFKFALAAVFACGVSALAPGAASAMPAARVGVDAAPLTENVHAVRMCNRWGRCVWSYAGHMHGPRYGWRRGYHYGWRNPHRHYGYGWRHYRHW